MRLAVRLILACTLSLIVAATACSTVPFTHRSQLMLVSEGQMTQLGAQAFQEVVHKEPLAQKPTVINAVDDVGWDIAHAAN